MTFRLRGLFQQAVPGMRRVARLIPGTSSVLFRTPCLRGFPSFGCGPWGCARPSVIFRRLVAACSRLGMGDVCGRCRAGRAKAAVPDAIPNLSAGQACGS